MRIVKCHDAHTIEAETSDEARELEHLSASRASVAISPASSVLTSRSLSAPLGRSTDAED